MMGCLGEDTPELMFRRHIKEMREYASEIAVVIGEGPIVRRIRKCADECEGRLDELNRRRQECARQAAKAIKPNSPSSTKGQEAGNSLLADE